MRLEKIDKKMQKQIDAYNEELITAHDLKLASAKAQLERDSIIKLLEQSKSGRDLQAEEDLQRRAKKAIAVIRSGDRIKSKQAIREMIDSITVSNGEELHIAWRGY
ncbi:hypothetical protein P9222_08315 [Paenibacillus amylolyticus]|nr:hypothetical protein [Paenibacillus amylolyticus]WFR64166.1 hypothetical protein P9222_08315 [Paenibacillus amylolyticus]